ncbi:hypothetical protein MRB53_026151 [Persea americana]|uniref:Uncharacterized protein n=1 Tax=Persea americana TaxID=3435 RepID=A0ACC2LHJ4_PERAE|nr:hypothetical protein MRB53_026151 [Persea americana]
MSIESEEQEDLDGVDRLTIGSAIWGQERKRKERRVVGLEKMVMAILAMTHAECDDTVGCCRCSTQSCKATGDKLVMKLWRIRGWQ